MKYLVSAAIVFGITSIIPAKAQDILGTWQLVKQTNCVEDKIQVDNEDEQTLIDDMKALSPASPYVVKFKPRFAGEESTRILTKKRSANSRNFAYKHNGETLLILDKKSQTITDSYIVDKLTADSLILSNATRPCETRVFLKIKERK